MSAWLLNERNPARGILFRSGGVGQFLALAVPALATEFFGPHELAVRELNYPLRVGLCRSCSHVQLMDSVPPRIMFEHYLYVSSASDTLKNHLRDLSRELTQRYRLGATDLVIDIGCNDGTLLRGFQSQGLRTLG